MRIRGLEVVVFAMLVLTSAMGLKAVTTQGVLANGSIGASPSLMAIVGAPVPRIVGAPVPRIVGAPVPRIVGAPVPRIVGAPVPRIVGAPVPR